MLKSRKTIPNSIKEKTFIHPQDKDITHRAIHGYKLPGFIDTHFHGAFGWDFSFGNTKEINSMLDKLVSTGVVGLFATLITDNEKNRCKALKDIASVAKKRKTLPFIEGIYLEGPFLSPQKAGSHPIKELLKPNVSMLKKWQEEAQGLIKVVTVAPELPGAIKFIEKATEMGITVALGHSNADWKTTQQAVDAGASHVTHLFNAMSSFHHREPSITSNVMTSKSLSVELIADCQHLAPEIIKFAFSLFNINQILLVSDSIAPNAVLDGELNFYNQVLNKKGNLCTTQNGMLFGGCTHLLDSLKTIHSKTNISWGYLGTTSWRNALDIFKLEPKDTEVFFDENFNWLASKQNSNWITDN